MATPLERSRVKAELVTRKGEGVSVKCSLSVGGNGRR
jgi:hypothetical protein